MKLSLCLPHHEGVRGSGGTVPRVLHLGSRFLYDRRLSGLQIRNGHGAGTGNRALVV